MTGTAQATEPERTLTAQEAWQVVEEFNLTLYPPRVCGGIWMVFGLIAGDSGIYATADTAVGAVEKFLRVVGGANGSQ